MTLRWRIARSAAPAVRKWGDEYVVHHALSNDTYRLAANAGRILTELMDADKGLANVGASICSTQDAEAENCLSALAELGLVAEC